MSKVFGIGFHKTGTSSLGRALSLLGYKVRGEAGISNPNIALEVEKIAFRLAEKFDAFQDNPWPILYQQLDQKYPNSKFILTIRDTDSWIKSVVKHFGTKDTPMRKWIYGVGHPQGNEDIYIERYQRHNQEVLEYFKDRPNDLLVINLAEGTEWEKLCSFLNKTIPNVPFPHSNKGYNRDNPILKASARFLRQGKRNFKKIIS